MGVTVLGIQHNFYPRSPCGERPARGEHHANSQQEFLSTLSLRRATWKRFPPMCSIKHFYPRSPCGERQSSSCRWLEVIYYFYPRSPCGERHMGVTVLGIQHNFYPRSPCGERPPLASRAKTIPTISIHALLAESDTWARGSRVTYVISIHALLAESDGRWMYHNTIF